MAMHARRPLLTHLTLVLLWFPSSVTWALDTPAGTESQADVDLRVTKLIEQLGADQFARRERAQGELERIGLPAFDALHDAQDHEDIEIALRARYLLRILPISWANESDLPEVKNLLRGYGDQPEPERLSRMDQLSALEDGRGISALCRLARFETNNVLAKRAALLVMQHPSLEGDGTAIQATREQLIKVIQATVGMSKRPVTQWLRVFAQTLENAPASVDAWQRIVSAEQEILAQFPDKTSTEVVRDLLRWQVDLLRRLQRSDDALLVVRRAVGMVDPSEENLVEMIDWLTERQYWSEIERLGKNYEDEFEGSALLLYVLAHTQNEQGKKDLATETAVRAFELESDRSVRHFELATELKNRGLFDWSEREFRHVIAKNPSDSPLHIRSRELLAEMLHDVDKDLPAAEALQVVVDELDKNPNALRGNLFREPGEIRSRMHYFYALHFGVTADRVQQRKHLEQAIEQNSNDADVLIAMFRLPDADEAWRTKTRELIQSSVENFRREISDYENEARRTADLDQRQELQRELAEQCNQFAWLVGNTEGDYQYALRLSRRSIELLPKAPGLWDTLGRCYFAVGDLENAIKSQQRALKMEPHSGQMKRQLELFQQTLAAKSKSKAP